MNEMVKKSWTGLDGNLVFEITINRVPADGVASEVKIFCRHAPHDAHRVSVFESRPSPFSIKFRSGCHVQGYLRQQSPVHINGVDCTGIFADMYFGMAGHNDDTHFEGLMEACPMRGQPLPPVPPPPPPMPPAPEPPNPDNPLPFVTEAPGELFTYVYVRRWPQVPQADLLYGFIQYSASSPPSSTFFEDLVAACHAGRDAAQALAQRFIDGAPPYEGQFLAQWPVPLRSFAQLAAQAQHLGADAKDWPEQLQEKASAWLAREHLDSGYLQSPDYRQALDRVWQSYFALLVTLGYQTALLVELTQVLWLAHLLQGIMPPATPGATAATLTAQQLTELVGASVLLPDSVFPLPPAALVLPASPPLPQLRGWIEPYAIGELQMVRQRLVRYAAGEVARIENVMRGERREVSSRRTQRQADYQEQRGNEHQLLRNDESNSRTGLLEEARKIVAEKAVSNQYTNFQTSYGPPTQATLNGSWTRITAPGANPGLEDMTRFARDILNKTVNSISRQVGQLRASSSMSQLEESVSSVIDNTGGQASLRAVFRWLNKVYEACVVNYGNRLMIEFMVYRPAARFIAQEQAQVQAGRSLARPVPPAALGIYSFEDIRPDNYARLGAAYGVTELQPPPLALKFVTATLRGGEEKQLAVPSGYCASSAFVSSVSTPPGLAAPVVLVGRQSFNEPSGSAPLQAYGEDATVPVSVMGYEPKLSPPSEAAVLVNVEVECVPTPRAMDEWRIQTYAAIVKAYQQQEALYYGQAAEGSRRGPQRSAAANRQLEQRELKSGCVMLLLERMAELTGPQAGSPPYLLVNEPRYLQFLDQVLEWNEMAYTFHAGAPQMLDAAQAGCAQDGGDDALFAGFLQAEHARVLLPVQPAHVMAFLYFFSCGLAWDGGDRWAPVNAVDLALANDLKHIRLAPGAGQQVGRSWEVVVPTSMQVLDEQPASAIGGALALGQS